MLRSSATGSAMDGAMNITVYVPPPLQDCCEGASHLRLTATSVRAILAEIELRYPSLYRGICYETGEVRRHVNIFVNTSHMREREGLDTALVVGDVVNILPAVSGG